MPTKQKVSANGTYVFDREEIEQLDDLSMTSILSAAVDTIPQDPPETESADIVATASNTTINALLSGTLEPDDQPAARSDLPARAEVAETSADLIDPALVFPEHRDGGKRRIR